MMTEALLILSTLAPARVGNACTAGKWPSGTVTVIGYVGEEYRRGDMSIGPFRPLVLLREKSIEKTDGSFLQEGTRFWSVLAPDGEHYEVERGTLFLDDLGEDNCVYHAWFRKTTPPPFMLLSNKRLSGVFRKPNQEERAYFLAHNEKCVDQGDDEPAEAPPCTRPELLAVTDVDFDGLTEFWSTEPYLWDTGISIWQRSPTGLTRIIELCRACAD